jgi:hypothetical protein
MDCIGCDKCRLWGKLQVNGYGTALKILFDYDENKNGENPPLRRTELVALINTFGRISHSLAAVRSFRQAVESGREDLLTVHPPVSEPLKVPGEKKSEPRRFYKDGGSSFYVENDDEDFDFDYDYRPWESTDDDVADTVFGALKAELGIFWRTMVWVLRAWFNIPRTL